MKYAIILFFMSLSGAFAHEQSTFAKNFRGAWKWLPEIMILSYGILNLCGFALWVYIGIKSSWLATIFIFFVGMFASGFIAGLITSIFNRIFNVFGHLIVAMSAFAVSPICLFLAYKQINA